MPRFPRWSEIPEALDPEEFWSLFGDQEHEQLDFKKGVSGEVTTAVAAMAMTHGGLLIHGVADDRTIVGCPLSQNTREQITRRAAECDVEVKVRSLRVGDRELTITAVPVVSDRIVTTPNGRLLRRRGSQSVPLRGEAMARFVTARGNRAGEDESEKVAEATHFDLDSVNVTLAAEGRARVERSQVLRALADLGVARPAPPGPPVVLRAAVVLFAVDPRAFLRGAAVQLVRRFGVGPAPGPTAEREEYAGPLVPTVERCLQFIDRHTRTIEAVVGLKRERLPEYPVEALREAVTNALAHRDYQLLNATVDVTVWDDRVEIRSPGSLPGHVTEENIRTEHYSRNPRVMRVLKTLGVVEEYGEGVSRMFEAMERRLMDPPRIEATPESVTVTLSNRQAVPVADQFWLQRFQGQDLTNHERQALVVARQQGAVTPRALRRLFPGVRVDSIINGALRKGLLRRVGNRGGVRYVLPEAADGAASLIPPESSGRLLEAIRQRGSISAREAADLLGITLPEARRILGRLVVAGRVRAEGRTRARRYHPV